MNIDILKVLKQIFGLIDKGQATRNEFIQAVNDLSSAIMMASIYTSSRFNSAISQKDKASKIRILTSVDTDEIEAHARMNGFCVPIAQASNEILHFYTDLNINRNIDKKSTADLKEIINTLDRGEGGLQEVMSEYINLPTTLAEKTPEEIDEWLRSKIEELANLSREAVKCQTAISKAI